jgi:hypothetical protein
VQIAKEDLSITLESPPRILGAAEMEHPKAILERASNGCATFSTQGAI